MDAGERGKLRFATNRSRCASARHGRCGRVPAQCGGAAAEIAAAGTRTFWRIERRIDLGHRHRELADADLVIRKKASIPSRSRSLGRLEGAIRDDPDRDRPEAGRDPGGSPGAALPSGLFLADTTARAKRDEGLAPRPSMRVQARLTMAS
ncbi:hypothetical protein [Burkholderia gladioli]|uniref:hypothetical protein n=1 Tax=Burkholderia gladioli TaxID=28095 RepID=UPI00164107C6|nr:hypothetical protein [Burkholderia gladioli]